MLLNLIFDTVVKPSRSTYSFPSSSSKLLLPDCHNVLGFSHLPKILRAPSQRNEHSHHSLTSLTSLTSLHSPPLRPPASGHGHESPAQLNQACSFWLSCFCVPAVLSFFHRLRICHSSFATS